MSDGSGENERILSVADVVTECATLADVLVRFELSPAYVALSIRAPTVDSVIEQPPAEGAAEQALTPSLTVTVPVGAGPPCTVGATVKVTATACPVLDGFGECAVSVVVVS